MSKDAAAGDMRTMAGWSEVARASASSLAAVMAAGRLLTRRKRGSWYLAARAWPDSPIRMTLAMLGDLIIS